VLCIVPGQTETLTLEIAHALVHQSGELHHHDETPDFQRADDENALPQHAHHDAGHHSVLPLNVSDLYLPPGMSYVRLMRMVGGCPDPHIDGPLRPPRMAV
jgi:hypothetical protein